MKTLVLMSLLIPWFLPIQTTVVSQDSCPVAVSAHKWTRSRQVVEQLNTGTTAPAEAMIADNKNFERGRRLNGPPGQPDPNTDSMDRRRANMEKMVQESRTVQPKPVDGFAYRVRVQNAGTKLIEVLFLEYQFIESSNPSSITRRQFLCGVHIKPEKAQDIQAFSVAGPSDVISVSSLAKVSDVFQEKVVINRVEYSDGTIWQRKGWNFGEIRLSLAAALATPWGSEMCRTL